MLRDRSGKSACNGKIAKGEREREIEIEREREANIKYIRENEGQSHIRIDLLRIHPSRHSTSPVNHPPFLDRKTPAKSYDSPTLAAQSCIYGQAHIYTHLLYLLTRIHKNTHIHAYIQVPTHSSRYT